MKHLISAGNRVLFSLSGGDILNVFEAVKQAVPTRQAAEYYGMQVGRNGMACCPFHDDKHPSMKVDRRFHCFGCQADGDVIDCVSRLFGQKPKEAAIKLAEDFGIAYDGRQKATARPHGRKPAPEQKYEQEEAHSYKVLCEYFHLLKEWERQYAPQAPGDDLHPFLVEALQRKIYEEYLLDSFLDGTAEERRELTVQQRKEVRKIEQRIAGLSSDSPLYGGGSTGQSGTDREGEKIQLCGELQACLAA